MRRRIRFRLLSFSLVILATISFQCGEKSGLLNPVGVGDANLLDYSRSDCLLKVSPVDPVHTMGDSAEVEIIVDGLRVTVIHKNAYFNCCIDSISVEFFQDTELLKLTEKEHYEMGCRCTCVFEVTAVLEVSTPGLYVLEIWSGDEFIWRGEIRV